MNRAKIAIRNDYNSSIFHQKFIVRDKGKATSGVLTGSTNFTPSGVAKNLNHLIVVHDDAVAREYDAEFREIWAGGFGRRSIKPNDKPKDLRVGGVRVKPLFAPEHAPEMEVMKQILKAEERIDFAMFTFLETSGIDDVLRTMARDTTVPITGLLDRAQANQDWAPTDDLSLYDTVSLNLTRKGIPGLGKCHHKLMVIDDQLVIGGSFNYTGPANRFNDENIIVIGDLAEDDEDAMRVQRRIGRFVRRSVESLVEAFGARVE